MLARLAASDRHPKSIRNVMVVATAGHPSYSEAQSASTYSDPLAPANSVAIDRRLLEFCTGSTHLDADELLVGLTPFVLDNIHIVSLYKCQPVEARFYTFLVINIRWVPIDDILFT